MQLKRLKVVKLNVQENNPIIRPMRFEDIDDVLELIEEWSREIFIEEFKNHFSYNFVLWLHNEIIGFINFWVVPDGIELNNITIHKNFRGKGYGKLFLEFLIKVANFFRADKIFLEVREDNIIAQNLYKKFGFQEIYIRKKYYSNFKDAIVMEKSIK